MNTSSPAVFAIILSYKDREAVIRCAESLRTSTYPMLKVVVVDNASSDGTAEDLRNSSLGFRLLVNERNLGFGGGCNRGLDVALAEGADFVLLLNQDTTVAPDMVERLVAFMEEHPDAGVVGPKTYFCETMPDGSPKLLYAGAWRGRLPLRQKVPGIERADTGPATGSIKTDYVWGHGMMLRSAALRKTGTFDPAFFMYYEDLDLCRRMTSAGFGVYCDPSAIMWHDIPDGARARASEYWRWACKIESTGIFHRKHFGWPTSALLTVLTVGAEAQLLFRQGHLKALGHLLRAYRRSLFPFKSGSGKDRETRPREDAHA